MQYKFYYFTLNQSKGILKRTSSTTPSNSGVDSNRQFIQILSCNVWLIFLANEENRVFLGNCDEVYLRKGSRSDIQFVHFPLWLPFWIFCFKNRLLHFVLCFQAFSILLGIHQIYGTFKPCCFRKKTRTSLKKLKTKIRRNEDNCSLQNPEILISMDAVNNLE